MARRTSRIASDDDGDFAIVVSDGESSAAASIDSASDEPKRKKSSKRKRAPAGKSSGQASIDDIENAGMSVRRPHGAVYHSVETVARLQEDLLSWFDVVREKRGMPWRKRYDPSLTMEEKGQRAYEIWVSEVMLQQTQVATVIDYWRRWIERWPTIADLAQADIEEVNSAWRGLGYYRRARSLLAGAKTVMGNAKYGGRLPSDPEILEKEIDGVGRYTAGAICSMAYGLATPIVDGNIHRLFTRLLALHAPQTAPSTIKLLWQSAQELVGHLPQHDRPGIAGDWNQALMELGSQVCKPVGPECSKCPLRPACKAFAELSQAPESAAADCALCAPIPASSETSTVPSVTVFPMRKEKKASRVEEEVVCITEWRWGTDRRWLFVKRPETGLLAGLFQPVTTAVPVSTAAAERLAASVAALAALTAHDAGHVVHHTDIGSIPHVFSHINMTYHVQHLVISTPAVPTLLANDVQAVWLDADAVERANVGTGVKKVWAEVYGKWGSFNVGKPAGAVKKRKSAAAKVPADGKVIKKIMMPMMPKKSAT